MVPGGNAMVFAAARGRALRLIRRDVRTGRDEPLMPEGTRLQAPDDVSPNGRQLAYEERTEAGPFNLWTMPLMGTATPSQIRSSPYNCRTRNAGGALRHGHQVLGVVRRVARRQPLPRDRPGSCGERAAAHGDARRGPRVARSRGQEFRRILSSARRAPLTRQSLGVSVD